MALLFFRGLVPDLVLDRSLQSFIPRSLISNIGCVLANAHDEDNIIAIIPEAVMNDKKAQTRERILTAASTALIARGPIEHSVNEIMGAAGLTVGGFYAHFDSKEALMLEAFSQLLAERREMVATIDDQLPGDERRALLAAFYLSRKHRDAQQHACPLPTAIGEMARLSADFRNALAEHVELMVAQLAASPEEADKTLADIALMVGGLALARALGPGELSDRVLRAAKSAVV
jgi:AcrR family transcriptional regulator